MEYKTVDGSLSGEIIADKNVYQNYFIILKSDVPMSVTVELQTTRLPDYIEKKKKKSKNKENTAANNVSSKDNMKNMKYLFGGIIAIVVIYLLVCKLGKKGGADILPKSGINQSLLTKLKKMPLE
jgi:hypothetical protein